MKRDVRLSADELRIIGIALRDEITKRTRSIQKAEANLQVGQRVNHNVLAEHYAMRDAAYAARSSVEIALRMLQLQAQRVPDCPYCAPDEDCALHTANP